MKRFPLSNNSEGTSLKDRLGVALFHVHMVLVMAWGAIERGEILDSHDLTAGADAALMWAVSHGRGQSTPAARYIALRSTDDPSWDRETKRALILAEAHCLGTVAKR